jgi:hypothetical protein
MMFPYAIAAEIVKSGGENLESMTGTTQMIQRDAADTARDVLIVAAIVGRERYVLLYEEGQESAACRQLGVWAA